MFMIFTRTIRSPEAQATSSERSLHGMGGGSQPTLPPGELT